MFLTFEMDTNRFEDVWCILQRETVPSVGTAEDGFLAGSRNFVTFTETNLLRTISELLRDSQAKWLLISRNKNLILDENLLSRLSLGFAKIAPHSRNITLVTAGGLGIAEERFCVLYSSMEPFIFYNPDPHPILDTMVDLYMVYADDAKDFITKNGTEIDDVFELAYIYEGYVNKNKISLYIPEFAAGINGHFVGRNIAALTQQTERLSSPIIKDPLLQTLFGTFKVPNRSENDKIGRPIPTEQRLLKHAVEHTLTPMLDTPSLTIITRTQFKRTFLLRRLLTSICRAGTDTIPIEILLSTDVPKEKAEVHLTELRADFPKLTLNLIANTRSEFSRVANLIGGAHAASGEYIWYMDDDDYIDLFAFQNIRRAFLFGARPFIIGDSAVHKEKWDMSNPDYPVLASSTVTTEYPGANWRHMFGGVNHLPICGPVIPKTFMLDCVSKFDFQYDLSEDYTLFLLLLSSPAIPPIVNLSRVISHISIRDDADNTVTMTDRAPWTRDITNYLYALLYNQDSRGRACWPTLINMPHPHQLSGSFDQFSKFQDDLFRKENQISNLRRENEYLRQLAGAKAATAPVSRFGE